MGDFESDSYTTTQKCTQKVTNTHVPCNAKSNEIVQPIVTNIFLGQRLRTGPPWLQPHRVQGGRPRSGTFVQLQNRTMAANDIKYKNRTLWSVASTAHGRHHLKFVLNTNSEDYVETFNLVRWDFVMDFAWMLDNPADRV